MGNTAEGTDKSADPDQCQFSAGCAEPKCFEDRVAQYHADIKVILQRTAKVQSLTDEGSTDVLDAAVDELHTAVEAAGRHLRKTPALTAEERLTVKEVMKTIVEKEAALKSAKTVGAALKMVQAIEAQIDILHTAVNRPDKIRAFKNPLLSVPVKDRPEAGEDDIPWSQVAAIAIDGLVDGLLIGLAYVASTSAGLSMAIATCIEMGFLGLSFSA